MKAEAAIVGEDEEKQQLRQKLAEAQSELELLSYAVSHDLRAPMRAIQGFSLILQEDYAAKLDDEGRRYLDIVINSSKQLHSYLDDLLTYSRLGRKNLSIQPIKVRTIVESALRVVAPDEKAQCVHIGELPDCEADPEMMKELWIQLLSNAFKFADPERELRVEIGGEGDNGHVSYWVSDNGLGLDEKHIDRLFAIFQKLHGHLKLPGNGAGLALCKRIVQKHNGEITAESAAGKGTTFRIRLPQE